MLSKVDQHVVKKLPSNAEASNVLVGEVDSLPHTVIAFVRLSSGALLGDLTEVPIPTRFIFVLLGPVGNRARYHEVGRSIATLMSDPVRNYCIIYFYCHGNKLLLLGIP